MPVWIVTGKLGSGKNLFVAKKIYEALRKKRKIAVNFDLNLSDRSDLQDAEAWRIPSNPTAADMLALGRGGPTEEKAGIIILDEGAMFLNSRDWQAANRQPFINFLLHSRKLCWDIYIIVQNVSALDKQIRNMIGEYLVSLSRLDRLKVPFLNIGLPQIHLAAIRYGMNPQNPPVGREWFRPQKLYYSLYDTSHIFNIEEIPVHRIPYHPKVESPWQLLVKSVSDFYRPMPTWWRFYFTVSAPVVLPGLICLHYLGWIDDLKKTKN